MGDLFIDLYLDEDVDVLVAELIRARGFLVETTRDAKQLNKSDAEQLVYAISQRKALVTHNRADFERLAQEYFSSGKMHYGVILAVRHAPQELARRLLILLNQVTADEMRNQVRYI